MTLRTDAIRELSAWTAPTPDQVALRDSYLEYLHTHTDATWRQCRPAHLTASALVLDPDRGRVLLTLHAKVGRWLQMGGHCEPADRTLADAARREAVEESGLEDLQLTGGPLRLDRHPVRCGQDGTIAEHLDVQYLALAGAGTRHRIGPESLDVRWWPAADLPQGADDSVRALVARAVALA